MTAEENYYRGVEHALKGQSDQAIACLTQAINSSSEDFHPVHALAYFARGLVFQSIGQSDNALLDFQATTNRNKCDFATYLCIAYICYKEGYYAGAFGEYSNIISSKSCEYIESKLYLNVRKILLNTRKDNRGNEFSEEMYKYMRFLDPKEMLNEAQKMLKANEEAISAKQLRKQYNRTTDKSHNTTDMNSQPKPQFQQKSGGNSM